MEQKYDVFISYRRKNGYEMAKLIRDNLNARGIHCYMDQEEDRAGRFDEALLTAIQNSTNFIIVLPKGALTRCKSEGDWVRREVMEAIAQEKNIVPIRYADFRWMSKWDETLPAAMRVLDSYNGVLASQEYFPCMIEKIISYLKDVKPLPPQTNKPSLYLESSRFLVENAKKTENLKSVDMAFHAGGEWHRNTDMVEAMTQLEQMGCPIRVIVNSAKAAEEVCQHMRQPKKKYVSFSENISDWNELAAENPQVEVRILDVPLLHRLYIVRGEHGGCANVKYYSYGNYTPEKDFRLSFDGTDFAYRLYAEEFEYLWNVAKPTLE